MKQAASKTFVKICGLKETGTIAAMAGLPVDYIGFIFAPSKRQISPEQAAVLHQATLTSPMSEGRPPRTVGVFVNPSIELLADTLAQVPLDIVQLHGQETAAFCREVETRFGVEVWRVLSVQEDLGEHESRSALKISIENRGAAAENKPATASVSSSSASDRIGEFAGSVSAILIDTAGGGTGRAFRWELIPSYQAAARLHRLPLIVAGGLTPDNISELVSAYQPDGVDISSGVETDGVKDINKIAAFAERVNRS